MGDCSSRRVSHIYFSSKSVESSVRLDAAVGLLSSVTGDAPVGKAAVNSGGSLTGNGSAKNDYSSLPSTSGQCSYIGGTSLSCASPSSFQNVANANVDANVMSRKRKTPMVSCSVAETTTTVVTSPPTTIPPPNVPLSKSLSYPSDPSATVADERTVAHASQIPSLKRVKPRPLNLSAAAAFSNGSGSEASSTSSSNNLLAPSPFFLHNNTGNTYTATSPLVTQFSQLYAAASLSAGLMCPTSPFTSFLTTAVSPMLGALSSPMAAAKLTPTAGGLQQPIFQFPPNPSHMAAMATAAMMSPLMPFLGAAMNLNGNGCPAYSRGNFVSRSPESLKTPVVPFPKDF